jgi:hypothetical protein
MLVGNMESPFDISNGVIPGKNINLNGLIDVNKKKSPGLSCDQMKLSFLLDSHFV